MCLTYTSLHAVIQSAIGVKFIRVIRFAVNLPTVIIPDRLSVTRCSRVLGTILFSARPVHLVMPPGFGSVLSGNQVSKGRCERMDYSRLNVRCFVMKVACSLVC